MRHIQSLVVFCWLAANISARVDSCQHEQVGNHKDHNDRGACEEPFDSPPRRDHIPHGSARPKICAHPSTSKQDVFASTTAHSSNPCTQGPLLRAHVAPASRGPVCPPPPNRLRLSPRAPPDCVIARPLLLPRTPGRAPAARPSAAVRGVGAAWHLQEMGSEKPGRPFISPSLKRISF